MEVKFLIKYTEKKGLMSDTKGSEILIASFLTDVMVQSEEIKRIVIRAANNYARTDKKDLGSSYPV